MHKLELQTEINSTKLILDSLLACIKEGYTEYYQDYIDISTYYLSLHKEL